MIDLWSRYYRNSVEYGTFKKIRKFVGKIQKKKKLTKMIANRVHIRINRVPDKSDIRSILLAAFCNLEFLTFFILFLTINSMNIFPIFIKVNYVTN